MKVELVSKTVPIVDGVSTAEFAAYVARIGKVKENPEKLIRYLIAHKHWSPFEHTFFTFKIRTSRAIGRELLRHRSFTFQELSQRYEPVLEMEPVELRKQADKNRQASMGDVIKFGEEDLIKLSDAYYGAGGWLEPNDAMKSVLRQISELYEGLLSLGVARECARMILPECTSTTILMSGSLRSWIHFIELRDAPDAQKEAQIIAKEIRVQLAKEVPMIFGEIENKE